MAFEANSTGFKVERWFDGNSPTPIWKVTWEPSWTEDDQDYDDELELAEEGRDFDTFEEAVAFGKSLIDENDRISRDE